jgi:hypothetical protein
MGVSLEGTLETVALPDVLALLSVTAKSGELRVESAKLAGSLWMDAGRISGFDVGNCASAVDALFALLRLGEGSFAFRGEGSVPVTTVVPQDVAPVLEEAEARLLEWPGIEAVVPSLASHLSLSGDVGAPVTLRPDQWQLVAGIGGGRTVADVLDSLSLGEFDGCKAVKELVELRLVHLAVPGFGDEQVGGDLVAGDAVAGEAFVGEAFAGEAVAGEAVAGEAGPGDAFAGEGGEVPDEPDVSAAVADPGEDFWGRSFQTPAAAFEPEPERGPEAEPEHHEPEPEPVNRGLLLKFLGSARN